MWQFTDTCLVRIWPQSLRRLGNLDLDTRDEDLVVGAPMDLLR